ncbi:hypothetical protein FACS1894139_01470 [Planctomycetales bacterium]|nr:hypothetical protein FACS1894139_01470 [Planctomycetales bacterium]
MVACERCGFVYASHLPEVAAFDAYYTHMNKYEDETEQPEAFTGNHDRIVQAVVSLVPDKTAAIVDVGCARSETLRLLKRAGYTDLTGIDPSRRCVEYLQKHGIQSMQATLNTVNNSRQYDVGLFLAVLEHIPGLNGALTILSRLIKPDGWLFINVPDITRPAARELPYQEFSREHINYFTPTSLTNLLLSHCWSCRFIGTSGEDCLCGFQRGGVEVVKKDEVGKAAIMRYLTMSAQYEAEIYANLSRYRETPVIIWGLGTFAQRLLTQNILTRVVALTDSNVKYHGKKFDQVPVVAPTELFAIAAPIIIATSRRYVGAITQTIRKELQLNNEIITLHRDYNFIYEG